MDELTGRPPPDWLVKLERSQAQIAAGESVPLEPFLNELRASIARTKAKRTAKPAGRKSPRDPPQPRRMGERSVTH